MSAPPPGFDSGDARSRRVKAGASEPYRAPSVSEVRAAARQLDGVVVPTSLVPARGPDAEDLLLAPEIHQRVGSFKIRGVFHAVARMDPVLRAQGISTVSAGNTAQALAFAGRHFGVEARSLMPEGAPRTKVDAVRALGGTPILVPTAEVFRYLRERGWESDPWAFVHPWTDRDVPVGHATLGLEIDAACPQEETVFVPVGGGGLLAGVGAALRALRPDLRIVAVEPRGCAAFAASLELGAATQVECSTLCDGVAVPYLTDRMYPVLAELADEVALVDESEVQRAIRRLVERDCMVVEGAGALAMAAALKTPRAERGVSVALLTGGSIDADKLRAILCAERCPEAPKL